MAHLETSPFEVKQSSGKIRKIHHLFKKFCKRKLQKKVFSNDGFKFISLLGDEVVVERKEGRKEGRKERRKEGRKEKRKEGRIMIV